MNIRQIEAFRAVMKSGSASRAAEALGITQPAVSRLVSELEKAIGFALFDRTRGRLDPTPQCRLFYTDVERTFVGLEVLKHTAAQIRERGLGIIRIANMPGIGLPVVSRAVTAFRAIHPDVAVSAQLMSTAEVWTAVATGQVDVGVAPKEIDIPDIEYQPFSVHSAVCAMSSRHRLAEKDLITPADLHGVEYIAHTPAARLRRALVEVMDAGGYKLNVVAETPMCMTLLAIVSEGVGVGLVNPMSVEGLDNMDLVLRPFSPPMPCNFFLGYRSEAKKSRFVRSMTKCLLDARSQTSAHVQISTWAPLIASAAASPQGNASC
ncbi:MULTISPECIES: LysR substrate-binding domain-containing protein [unclassified Chelatococcus]|uniref:LysR family transcriptional regulator n=1 Tax=unclassified Chelatococcus TaxID=2638111 RepID=UPI001BD114CE|nr:MULTISPECIES: LysR substrate-binding domain-containing protein [unclassified Chelatococcus]MBS7700607.1 LysR family transcriptional regulator [Chelatococcus sp. YT9]MBX3558722.1 LysR family transcriptional regulator [Chelatococcus sp.]